MYIVYEQTDDNLAIVTMQYYGDDLDTSMYPLSHKVTAIPDPPVPVFGKNAILYFDKTEGLMKYIYKDRPLTLEEKITSLTTTADEQYQFLNLAITDIEVVRAAKINQLKQKCTQAIYDGFTSSTGHTFGFNGLDQDNFNQQATMILLKGMQDTDRFGWKSRAGVISITVAEFKIIAVEGENHKRSNQEKYWGYEELVLAAETNPEIDSVNWE